MAKVYFAPNKAIKYVGSKSKEFTSSLARPKPVLKKGDIVIVDKKTCFNLVTKGFKEFVEVEDIEFVKSDVKTLAEIKSLTEKLVAFEAENNSLFAKNVELGKELEEMKNYYITLPKLDKDK